MATPLLRLLASRVANRCIPSLMKNCNVVAVPARKMAYWNKDWMPGPYPRTPEERAAAAKKYNMRVEDYEPYPDDGFGHGDYPMLPRVSAEGRDPYENYDIPVHKRNFGEPMHYDFDAMVESRWSPDVKERFTNLQMLGALVGVWGGLLAIFWYFDDIKVITPAMPKQYPYTGDKHYTFESADGGS